jgi:hypothetical protein
MEHSRCGGDTSTSRSAVEKYSEDTRRNSSAQHVPTPKRNGKSKSPGSSPSPSPAPPPDRSYTTQFFPLLPPDRVLFADGSASVFVFVSSGVLKNASMEGCYSSSARLMTPSSGVNLTALPLSSDRFRRTTFV